GGVPGRSGSSPSSAMKIVNNADWYSSMNVIDLLRDVGKHFRVNVMLTREPAKSRLNSADASAGSDTTQDAPEGISFTEFSYQLLQGYDFYHLHHHENCHVQIG